LLVGCYSPTYQTGTPCETACPGELVCVDRVCREPGDVAAVDAAMLVDTTTVDGPAGDVDGDGHGDGADNCPGLASPDRRRGRRPAGDVTVSAPGGPADADSDKIGDACDWPSAAQVLRFFDPFHRIATNRLVRATGSARRYDCRDRGSGAADPDRGSRQAAGDRARRTADHQLAIAFGVNANETRYHYCEFYDDPNNEGATLISEAIDGSFPSLAQTPYNGVLPLGAFAMRIDESVAAQRIVLQATVGGQVQPLLMASTANAPVLLSGSKLGFWVENIDARIHYVWVIETLP
jgi:hypothetical protein